VSEQLNFEETDAVCMRAMDNLWNRLAWQAADEELLKYHVGVVGESRLACPHVGKPYTPCGQAIFTITRDGFEVEPNCGPSTMDEKLEYPAARLVPKEVKAPNPGSYKIEVYVHKVVGACPAAIEGTKFEYLLCNKISEGQCGFSVNSLYPYVTAMTLGAKAVDLGIAEEGEDGFVTCPAWGPPTCEATVIFRLHPVPVEEGFGDNWYEDLAKIGHVSIPTYFMDNFASEETKLKRKKLIEEWDKLGRPKYWEKWGDVQKILSTDKDKAESIFNNSFKKTRSEK
jgi:uncharacterized repeat protein (TIGR04076 family)